MIKIADWIRYEVNNNGDPAKEGDALRAGALRYIRLKNHGHATNRGLNKLQKLAKGKTMEVVGIFTQFLQLAGNGTAEYRGILREQKNGEPATIEDLAEILPATANQIAFAVKCLSNPAVSWILVDKEGFRENPRNSGITSFNTTQFNSIQHNTTQPTTVVFEKWNSFKGKKWKSHKTLSYESKLAITEQLKHYSTDELCSAVENYARVLLSSDFKWSYAWTLQQFLTRTSPTNRKEQQLWRFLPNNYHDEDYLTDSAKTRRVAEKKEYYEFMRDCEENKLIEAYKANKNNMNWLIDEVRPEIKEILAERAKAR